jgi:hypothetical protein
MAFCLKPVNIAPKKLAFFDKILVIYFSKALGLKIVNLYIYYPFMTQNKNLLTKRFKTWLLELFLYVQFKIFTPKRIFFDKIIIIFLATLWNSKW